MKMNNLLKLILTTDSKKCANGRVKIVESKN